MFPVDSLNAIQQKIFIDGVFNKSKLQSKGYLLQNKILDSSIGKASACGASDLRAIQHGGII